MPGAEEVALTALIAPDCFIAQYPVLVHQHSMIKTLLFNQLSVYSTLHNLAMVHDKNLIHILQSDQSMCD
jgi:hypothetical protein